MAKNSKTPPRKRRRGSPRASRPRSAEKKIGVGKPLVEAFAAHCCDQDAAASAKVSDLWAAFVAFVGSNAVPTHLPTPLPTLSDAYRPIFSKRLGELGFPPAPAGGVKRRAGLKLKPVEAPRLEVPSCVPGLDHYVAAYEAARGGDRDELNKLDALSMAMQRRLLDVALGQLNQDGASVVDTFEVDGKERQRLAPAAEFVNRGLANSGITAAQQLFTPDAVDERDAGVSWKVQAQRMKEATEAKAKTETVH